MRRIQQTLDLIVSEIENPHDNLVDEWMDYVRRIGFFLPTLQERDLPVIADTICSKKMYLTKWWGTVNKHLQFLDRYRDTATRLEAESHIRNPDNWKLHAAGVQDGHSFYIWHFKYSKTLGAISLIDREDEKVHVRLLGV